MTDYKYILSCIAISIAVYCLYIQKITIEDYNWESMDIPFATNLLLNGMQKEALLNCIEEDPQGTFAYPGNIDRFAWYTTQSFHVTCFSPFIKIFGLSGQAIAWHGLFYSILSWVGVFCIGLRLYGKWEALLAVFFLVISLSWLIHTKDGGYQPLPCACLMIWLVYFMVRYVQSGNFLHMIPIGALLGLGYFSAWIGFAFMLVFVCLTFFCLCPFHGKHAWLMIGSLVAVLIIFPLLYSYFFKIPFTDTHGSVYNAVFSRFTQSAVPGVQPGFFDKAIYAVKSTFYDMKAFDHPNKYLEGYPSIPYLFTGFFVIGLFFSKRDQFYYDGILWIWIISVFGVLCTIYLYAHRYALLALPAMALLAANGVVQLIGRYRFIMTLIVLMGITTAATHYQYYSVFTKEREPNYEVDRMRGHAIASEWLKTNYSTGNTVVVLGDSTNLSPFPFIFHNYQDPFAFVVWTNYFNNESQAKDVNKFEGELMKHGFQKIVYLFSTQILIDEKGKAKNSWASFVQAHEGIQPSFVYSYRGRALLAGFEVSKNL